MGRIFDDRGNRMSPSYSVKNGIRYRFYVSSALLRGRKAEAGTIGRVAAQEIETIVLGSLKEWLSGQRKAAITDQDALARLKGVSLHADSVVVTALPTNTNDEDEIEHTLRMPWSRSDSSCAATALEVGDERVHTPDAALLQSIVRSHAWLQALRDGAYESVEDLAEANQLHPKVVRLALRLPFLSPEAIGAILIGSPTIAIQNPAAIPRLLPLSWARQQSVLG